MWGGVGVISTPSLVLHDTRVVQEGWEERRFSRTISFGTNTVFKRGPKPFSEIHFHPPPPKRSTPATQLNIQSFPPPTKQHTVMSVVRDLPLGHQTSVTYDVARELFTLFFSFGYSV